jgi:hypothetical protein
MTVALPTSRSIAMHEAHHAAALCLAGVVPTCVRIDWPTAELAGLVTVDWGDGADHDKAKRVLVAVLLGAMTEGFEGWDHWPIDPDRAPLGARRDAEQAAHLAGTSSSTRLAGCTSCGRPTGWLVALGSGDWPSRSPTSWSASRRRPPKSSWS